MARENYDVEVPEGTHLGFSRDTDGAYRAHLFDDETNELVGHAELFEHESDDASGSEPVYIFVNNDEPTSREDETEVSDALAALAALGILMAAERAAPHLKEWWNSRAVPFLKDKRAKFSRPRKAKREYAAAEVSVVAETAPTPPGEVVDALDEYRASMSSAEARERFIAALVAQLFSERQLRLLRNARIEDESGSLELASAVHTLTPQQLEDSFRTMLEANPSWPDRGTVAELGNLLNGSRGEPQALPLQVGNAKGKSSGRRRKE